jgi:hypothetical protein
LPSTHHVGAPVLRSFSSSLASPSILSSTKMG